MLRPARVADRLRCVEHNRAPCDSGPVADPPGAPSQDGTEAMDGSIDTLAALIATAAGVVADAVRRFDIPLLVFGLVLHLVADLVRNRGWYGVLRAAGPEYDTLRVRDVQAAAFAGGSVNALVPARAGDLVKLAVVRRRGAPDARMPTLDGDARARDALRMGRGRRAAGLGPGRGLPAGGHRRRRPRRRGEPSGHRRGRGRGGRRRRSGGDHGHAPLGAEAVARPRRRRRDPRAPRARS